MSEFEVFLDDTPGEMRGVVARDGRFDRLLIQRESDLPQHRLGARSVGRVTAVDGGLRGAFVDLGAPEPFGFLPLRKADGLTVGEKVEVEVSAEPREQKGPTLRLTGAGEGEPRLLGGTLGTSGQSPVHGELVTPSQVMRLSQAHGHLCACQIFIH